MLDGALDYVIDQDRGALATGGERAALFHSLAQLDIGTGESATFRTSVPIDTLIARITNGSPSQIDGALRYEGLGAPDVFLLNSAGILFGENASLDLPASFHATSADHLRFADDTTFESAGQAPTALSVAPVAAFGFTEGPAGDIEFDRPLPLQVRDGSTLSAVGGDVALRRAGTVLARGGTVQLVAVGEAAGEVPVHVADLAVRDGSFAASGEVFVGEQSTIEAADFGAPDANQGRIVIRAGRFVSDASFLFAGGDGGGTPAIDVEVAGELELRRSSLISFGAGSRATDGIRLAGQLIHVTGSSNGVTVQNVGSGGAGDLVVDADALVIDDGGQILTETSGPARGAGIAVDADAITIGTASQIRSRTSGLGFDSNDAGDIRIETGTLLLRDGAQISGTTEGSGRAADVTIDALGEVRLEGQLGAVPSGVFARSGAAPGSVATGAGGDVRIEAGALSMVGGAQISTRTFGSGDAGRIDVEVADGRVMLSGGGNEPTTISARGATGSGNAVSVTADVLVLEDGGRLYSTADATGDAGDIHVAARQLLLRGRAPSGGPSQITAETRLAAGTEIGGSAGRIDLDVGEDLTLADGAAISARSIGRGATNDIDIQAGGRVVLEGGASISSEASYPSAVVPAGDILIDAGGEVAIRDGASISARADGLGDAGNIEIRGGSIEIRGASLTTNAASALGGNVVLASPDLVQVLRSAVTTDVGGGDGRGGDVTIEAGIGVINDSTLTANARGSADAGNVFIRVEDALLPSRDSRIEASAELGIDGTVLYDDPADEVVGELSQLPAQFLDASSELAEPCLARDAPVGSFAVRHTHAPEPPPDAPLPPDAGDAGSCEPH